MNLQYYNRYNEFLINGQQTVVPYINLPAKTTDKNFIYNYIACDNDPRCKTVTVNDFKGCIAK
jgi:hypothetical protein